MRGIIATAYRLHFPDEAVVLVETDNHPGSHLTGTRYVLRITREAHVVDVTEESGEVYSTYTSLTNGYEGFKEVIWGHWSI